MSHILVLAIVLTGVIAPAGRAQTPPPVTLQFERGGSAIGPILDWDEKVVVIHYQGRPCAFDFDELTVASAYQTKKTILAGQCGGVELLEAQDHLELGRYALSRDHVAVANNEFTRAVNKDAELAGQAQAARRQYQARKKEARQPENRHKRPEPNFENETAAKLPGLEDSLRDIDPADRERINQAYRQFGSQVRDRINPDLQLVETDHFLIWTDWPKPDRPLLASWCEEMYQALCRMFGLPESHPVFLAKCPIFCFKSKARFLRFLKTFEHYQGTNLVGYAITQPSGHVHVSAFLRGPSDYELKRFAATLVHEGAHGFVHRYATTGNITGWLGEGLADYMAQEVLGEDCTNGRQARLIARQYVAADLPIDDLLQTVDTLPPAAQYPLAHSLVRFLIENDATAFANMLAEIKRTRNVESALSRNYKGLNFANLDQNWRAQIRAKSSQPR